MAFGIPFLIILTKQDHFTFYLEKVTLVHNKLRFSVNFSLMSSKKYFYCYNSFSHANYKYPFCYHHSFFWEFTKRIIKHEISLKRFLNCILIYYNHGLLKYVLKLMFWLKFAAKAVNCIEWLIFVITNFVLGVPNLNLVCMIRCDIILNPNSTPTISKRHRLTLISSLKTLHAFDFHRTHYWWVISAPIERRTIYKWRHIYRRRA